ncbi:recombinase family protein [Actinomadura fibrosa]|uniref:Recombinase family protein n=1 Tax=Actinomadura fibrosa TaxID=111802 RepID=A0ABW2XJP4_9ACTN|nr:recombinase family protein [Actinomadura fibrosa]
MSPHDTSPEALSPISSASTIRGITVGLYLRISEDKGMRSRAAPWREIGEEVSAQREELEGLAAELGWTVAEVYDDNDTSATDPFTVRDGFERMLVDLQTEMLRGILFYHSDRLARQEYDAARVNRLYQMNPTLVGLSLSGSVDLSTQEGRAMFTMQATMAGIEAANAGRRVARKRKRLAERGIMGGTPRPFGWADDRLSLHPEEAAHLASAIRAVPGGKKVGTVRREWFTLGHKKRQTRKGKERHGERDMPFEHSTVEAILANPRNCGYMTHLPQSERRNRKTRPWMPDHVVYRDGEPVRGPWEPIVTPEEWAACVRTIAERKKERRDGLAEPHDTSEKYLLAGVARCGRCMFPLTANWYSKASPSFERYGYRYACLSSLGGCGGVSRVGPLVEALVETEFLDEVRRSLDEPVVASLVVESVHVERLTAIEKEMDAINERRKAERIPLSLALDLIEELESERLRLSDERRALQASKVKRRTEYPTLLRQWQDYTIAEKKQHLKRSIRAAVVHPQGRGRQPFKPELIEIVWQ